MRATTRRWWCRRGHDDNAKRDDFWWCEVRERFFEIDSVLVTLLINEQHEPNLNYFFIHLPCAPATRGPRRLVATTMIIRRKRQKWCNDVEFWPCRWPVSYNRMMWTIWSTSFVLAGSLRLYARCEPLRTTSEATSEIRERGKRNLLSDPV